MIRVIKKNSHLSTNLTIENGINTLKLKDKIITEELQMLHIKLVVVPIDKAISNVAFYLHHVMDK